MSKSRTVNVKTPRGVIPATYSPVTVTDVREHKFRDDVDQAEIRQMVTRHYPSARANNSMNEGLYNESEFDFESKDFGQERVAWINIPKGKTQQDVEKQIAKFEACTIYRVLADDVRQVLSAEQLHAISSPDFDYSLEKAMNSHVVLLVGEDGMPSAISASGEVLEGAIDIDEDGRVISILKPEGLQYSSKGFALSHTDDTDLRAYATAELQEENAVSTEVVDEAKTTAVI